jgi:predicted ArsR family transcriptional regulator
MSPTQRRVLTVIQRQGEATAEELATHLGISASAVRQHLSALRAGGFVDARQQRGGTGRPADCYHATDAADALFATSATNDFAVELLSMIEDENPELVDAVFERRSESRVDDARQQLADLDPTDRITAMARLLDAEGYMADVEQCGPGVYRLRLHSCAMWNVANRYRQVCTSELDFVRNLIPEATVTRVTHKVAGSHVCAYEITL